MAKKTIKIGETVEFQGKKMDREQIFSVLENAGINILNAGIGNLSLTQLASIGEMLLRQAEKINQLETKVQKRTKLLSMKEATAFVTVANIKRHIVQQLTAQDIINIYSNGKISSLKSNGKRQNKSQFIIDSEIAVLKAEIKDLVKPVNNILKVLQDVDNVNDDSDAQEADDD